MRRHFPGEASQGPRQGLTAIRVMGLFTLLTMVMGGCAMVGPDYVKPEPPAPEGWLQEQAPGISREAEAAKAWWTGLGDPILNDLIDMAYRQNLSLQIAGLRILEARAQLGILTGNLYPQVQQASGSYTRSEISENASPISGLPDAFKDAIDTTVDNYQVGFDAAWELDFWGKFRRSIESGEAGLDASIADYDDALVVLTAEVARVYVIIRTLELRLKIAQENVAIQQRSLEIAQVRFDNGDVSELDVQQAKSLLHNTQSLIPRLQTSLRQAENGLSLLLGQPPGQIRTVLGAERPIPKVPAEIAVGIPAELLRRRPDIRRSERQMAAQSALIGVAKADLLPHFSLFGTIGLQSEDSGDLFESDSFTYGFGPAFRWDLFNYGRIKNDVRVQDARFQQLLVNHENAVLNALREVEDAMIAFLRTQEEERYLAQSATASRRAVDLAMLQYREGLTSYQRVLDTQRFLTQQLDLLSDTQGTVVTNLVALYKSLGGGWQIRVGGDFVPPETLETMRSRTDWGDLSIPADDADNMQKQ